MANNIQISLEILAKEALASLNVFASNTKSQLTEVSKSIEKTNKGFVDIERSIKQIGATLAGAFTLKNIVEAGIEAERSIKGLEGALKLAGEAVDTAPYEKLARELQNLIGIDDDLILAQATLLKNIGASNKQIEQILRTAAQLSTVLKQDFGTSVQTLVQTFSGTLPRSLRTFIPELKNLTKEQLAAGTGLDLITSKLKNFAQEVQGTASVQLQLLKVNFGNVIEQIGLSVVRSDLFTGTLKFLNKELIQLQTILSSLNFSDVIQGIVRLTAVVLELFILARLPALMEAFRYQVKLATGSAIINFTTLKGTVLAFIGSLQLATVAVNLLKASLTIGLSLIIDQFIKLSFEAKSFSAFFEIIGLNIYKAFFKIFETLLSIGSALIDIISLIPGMSDKLRSVRERLVGIQEASKKFGEDLNKEINSLKVSELNEQLKSVPKNLKDIQDSGSQLGASFEKPNSIFKSFVDTLKNLNKLKDFALPQLTIGITAAVSAEVSKGFQGAVGIIKEMASIVGETLVPGFGQVIGELVGFLSQSPEQLKATLKTFFDSFPLIIQNIIENIPVLLTGLVEGLGTLVENLPSAIAKGIDGLLERLPELLTALAAQAPFFANKLSLAMIRETPNIAKSFATEFIKQLPTIASEMAKALVNSIKDAVGSVGGVLGIGGGGGGIVGAVGGVISGIGDFFGFAEGGLVPAGFPNDTFPARLTSGEFVIDRSLSERLNAFLSKQDATRPVVQTQQANRDQVLTINLQVGEAELANVLLNLNRQGFRVS